MSSEGLWAELKRRRVTRVVVAYGAVAIAVLEVADLTFDAMGVPAWTFRFLVFLALAGFPIVVAMSWALQRTPEGLRSEAGPASRESTRRGRWIIGGAGAVSLTIAGFLTFERPAPVPGIELDSEAIAVVPFRVTSNDPDLIVLGEGIVDWLTPHLDPSMAVVDESSVLSAWQAMSGGSARAPTEEESLRLGDRVGAAKVLTGAVVGAGSSFTVNGRLVDVGSTEEVGRVSVEGTTVGSTIAEAVRSLAGQVLSLDAGIQGSQVDHLLDVPIEALRFYLDGRLAYRRAAHLEARTLFARALDVDSTFALAALRLREMTGMTLDAPRLALAARADRILALHPDRLPADDLRYYQLWLSPGNPRSASQRIEDARTLVSELPHKPQSWYTLGDFLLHDAPRLPSAGFRAESVAAFERALELDEGYTLVRLHLLFDAAFHDDTTAARERADPFARQVEGSESATYARGMLGYLNGDNRARQGLAASLDTLSLPHLRYLTYLHGLSGTTVTNGEMDLLFDRLSGISASAGDRADAEATRLRYLFSAGRIDDAIQLLDDRIAAGRERPTSMLFAHLYWDAPEDAARRALPASLASIAGVSPRSWANGGEDVCIVATWRARMGEDAHIERAVRRLRGALDESSPNHDGNAVCAEVLEAIKAETDGAPDLGDRLAQLVASADRGLVEGRPLVTRELSRMLENHGEIRAAARVASYRGGSVPYPPLRSTVDRDAARLYDAVGELGLAHFHYRRFVRIRPEPDASLIEEVATARNRLVEIEEALGGSR